jgi:glucan 1,3-beta-glucosidase
MDDIKHQGIAPEEPDASYQVFRNVKDFGAVGDGVHDDTDAINLAITSTSTELGQGERCAPGSCNSTTITPALVISILECLNCSTADNCLGLFPQWYLPCV